MKELIFIRHAKSSWETQAQDHDRPLDKSGIKRAESLSLQLQTFYNISNFSWYSSTAQRAMSTARIFQNVFQNIIQPVEQLYTFSYFDLMKTISKLPEEDTNAVLFGHNPAFSDAVNNLGNYELGNLPTCGIVGIRFNDQNWETLHSGKTFLILTSNLEYYAE